MNEALDSILMMKAEFLLVIILFIILIIKLVAKEPFGDIVDNASLLYTVNILLALNLVVGFFDIRTGYVFGDMYETNPLVSFEKNILNAGTLIISLLAHPWLKTHKHASEFYMLLIATLIGMFFMISSRNLLMFYLGLELSTIPLAALANFDLEKRRSSEAAFKMIISSAFSSGLLLFGISLVYGMSGMLSFSELPDLNTNPLSIFAFVLLITGFAFKISAVPFHLWTADVYEGSPMPVTAYLSVISKGAVVFVLAFMLTNIFAGWEGGPSSRMLPSLLAFATILIGNLFALRQRNIKRFLAFSSITQVGFILVGLTGAPAAGHSSSIYFVLVYIFSNLGAFAVIALVSAVSSRERIEDYKGFYKTNPKLTWVLAISLFSLAGVPPTAGFFAKFFLLLAGATLNQFILVGFAALNMVIALFYYLKIVRAMFMDTNENPIQRIQIPLYPAIAMIVCLIGIVVLGVYSGAFDLIYDLVRNT